jgi:hypothetical protein
MSHSEIHGVDGEGSHSEAGAHREIRHEIDRLRRESASYFQQSQEMRKRARAIDAKIQELMKQLRR